MTVSPSIPAPSGPGLPAVPGASAQAGGLPGRKPGWLKKRVPLGRPDSHVTRVLDRAGLVTVCEEARCPNQHECWGQGTATFMILGDVCTRRCAYCAVGKGTPAPPAADEPERLAQAVVALELAHVVITSVDRDDLPDFGASQFVRSIESVRRARPACAIEVLTPDFAGDREALEQVVGARPDVFNHNIEMVPRLFPAWRGGGDYARSLALLAQVRERAPGMLTKSGFMVGLGETLDEIRALLADLRVVGVDAVTVGQYLRPDRAARPVERYLTPAEFQGIRRDAKRLGFARVAAGPFVRSSYHARELHRRLPATPAAHAEP